MQTHFLLALTSKVISNVTVSISVGNNEAKAKRHHCSPQLFYLIPRIVVWGGKLIEIFIKLMTSHTVLRLIRIGFGIAADLTRSSNKEHDTPIYKAAS